MPLELVWAGNYKIKKIALRDTTISLMSIHNLLILN